jgi:hypothetical protein
MMASIIRCRAGDSRGQAWISFSRRLSDSELVLAGVVPFVVASGMLRAEEAGFSGDFGWHRRPVDTQERELAHPRSNSMITRPPTELKGNSPRRA